MRRIRERSSGLASPAPAAGAGGGSGRGGGRGLAAVVASGLDPQRAAADPQRVARRERHRLLDPAAVDEGAVARPEIADLDLAVDLLQVGMASRDLRVVEREVAGVVTADHEAAVGPDLDPAIGGGTGEDDQLGHLCLRPVVARR
jgi:hypothetical protein